MTPTIEHAGSLEGAVARLLGRAVRLVLLGDSLDGGNNSWAACFGTRAVALVQTPVDPGVSGAGLRRGFELAARLHAEDLATLVAGRVARPLGSVILLPPGASLTASPRFHVWAWVDGAPLLPTSEEELARLLAAAAELLVMLGRSNAVLAGALQPGGEWWATVGRAAVGRLGSGLERAVAAVGDTLAGALATTPCGLTHGDFWWGNLLLHRSGAATLTDWEEASLEGWPPFDPLFFALTLLIDLAPGDPGGGPWRGTVLRWTTAQLGWDEVQVEAGLLLAGLVKATRERERYRQHDTPAQRWLQHVIRKAPAR